MMHFSATVILTRLGPCTSYWTQKVWSVSWNRKWEHAFLDRITLIWQIDKRYLFIYLFKTKLSDYSLLPKLLVVRAPASPIRLSADTGTQNSPWHRLGHETPCMPCAPEVTSQLTGYVDTAPHEGPFPSLRSVVQNGRQKWVLKISLNRLQTYLK